MRWIFLLLATGATLVGRAQPARTIDSLEKKAAVQSDTILVKTLNELTWQYRLVNQEKAISYGNRAVSLSQQLKFDKGLSQAYNDLGIIYYDRQEYSTALSLYEKALGIRRRQNDILGMAKLHNKIGIVHQRSGAFDKALENQLEALKLFEMKGDDYGVSYSLNNIGILNQNLGRLDEAIVYHQRSERLKEKLGDRIGLAGSYVNLANIYTAKDDYSKAKSYFIKAEKISRELGNKEYLSNALNNLSNLQSKTGHHKEAIDYAQESYTIRKGLGDTKGMVSALSNIGFSQYSLGDLTAAEESLSKALQMARGVPSCRPELPMLYKNLSLVYEKQDKVKALDMYRQYSEAKDSLFTSDLNSKFAELQSKYETLEKEKRIAVLNRDNALKQLQIQERDGQLRENLFELTQQELTISQTKLRLSKADLEVQQQAQSLLQQKLDATEKAKNIEALKRRTDLQQMQIGRRELELSQRNVIIACLALGLLALAGLGYSFYRRKQLQQQAKLQAEVMRQQELATKKVIEAEEAERQRIARDLHDGVGQMMSAARMNLSAFAHTSSFGNEEERKNFDNILSLIDESCQEVRSVSHVMMPNALVKNGLDAALREFLSKLDGRLMQVHLYTSGLEKRMDADKETVFYRVVQECIHNVIKHARAQTLDISIVRDDKEITATIEDDGKGFVTSKTSEGIGLKNIKTRMDYLRGTVDIDSSPGKGTLVALHLPL